MAAYRNPISLHIRRTPGVSLDGKCPPHNFAPLLSVSLSHGINLVEFKKETEEYVEGKNKTKHTAATAANQAPHSL